MWVRGLWSGVDPQNGYDCRGDAIRVRVILRDDVPSFSPGRGPQYAINYGGRRAECIFCAEMCIVLYGARTMPRGLFPSSVTVTVSEAGRGRPRASRHRLAFQHRFIHGLCGLKHFLFAPIRNGSRLCSFGSEESDTRIGIFSYFQESSHATFKRSIIQKLPSFLPGPVPLPFSPDSRNLKGHLSARFCRPLARSLALPPSLPLSPPVPVWSNACVHTWPPSSPSKMNLLCSAVRSFCLSGFCCPL